MKKNLTEKISPKTEKKNNYKKLPQDSLNKYKYNTLITKTKHKYKNSSLITPLINNSNSTDFQKYKIKSKYNIPKVNNQKIILKNTFSLEKKLINNNDFSNNNFQEKNNKNQDINLIINSNGNSNINVNANGNVELVDNRFIFGTSENSSMDTIKNLLDNSDFQKDTNKEEKIINENQLFNTFPMKYNTTNSNHIKNKILNQNKGFTIPETEKISNIITRIRNINNPNKNNDIRNNIFKTTKLGDYYQKSRKNYKSGFYSINLNDNDNDNIYKDIIPYHHLKTSYDHDNDDFFNTFDKLKFSTVNPAINTEKNNDKLRKNGSVANNYTRNSLRKLRRLESINSQQYTLNFTNNKPYTQKYVINKNNLDENYILEKENIELKKKIQELTEEIKTKNRLIKEYSNLANESKNKFEMIIKNSKNQINEVKKNAEKQNKFLINKYNILVNKNKNILNQIEELKKYNESLEELVVGKQSIKGENNIEELNEKLINEIGILKKKLELKNIENKKLREIISNYSKKEQNMNQDNKLKTNINLINTNVILKNNYLQK